MKTGVLGGTFNPVHNGHLGIAAGAMVKLELEKVLFVLTNQTPLKENSHIISSRHRVEMLRLAIAEKKGFELSKLELQRTGLSYTVDTISLLNRGLGPDDEIFFIMGSDRLSELPQWKEPDKLIKLCRLAVFNRPDVSPPDLGNLEKRIPGLSLRVVMLDMKPISVSSTDIRNRVGKGLSIHGMVPPGVEQYILNNRLYLP